MLVKLQSEHSQGLAKIKVEKFYLIICFTIYSRFHLGQDCWNWRYSYSDISKCINYGNIKYCPVKTMSKIIINKHTIMCYTYSVLLKSISKETKELNCHLEPFLRPHYTGEIWKPSPIFTECLPSTLHLWDLNQLPLDPAFPLWVQYLGGWGQLFRGMWRGRGNYPKGRWLFKIHVVLAKGAFILGGDYSTRPMFEGVINGGGRIFCGNTCLVN